MPPTLDSLSTEILLKIFIYLNIRDLCKVKQTCKRFNEVINFWGRLFINCNGLLVTNQVNSRIKERKNPVLNPFEQLRISINWKSGIYKQKNLLYTKKKYMPWLQLGSDYILLSRSCRIKVLKRTPFGIDQEEIASFTTRTRSEVGRFVFKDDVLVSGQSDGSLCAWFISSWSNKNLFSVKNHHRSDINSVDLLGDLVATGSRDEFVRISKTNFIDRLTSIETINLYDRVWSVKLYPELLAIGTAGITTNDILVIVDLESGQLCRYDQRQIGCGVLDIHWEDRNTLWTGGYDATVKKWDRRVGVAVQTFDDPCNSTIYSFQYDRHNTLITGTQSNGRVVLWDTRCTRYVQMYFMECCRKRSSPIYSLDYDQKCLFTATDQNLSILDFATDERKARDYSNLFA